MLTILADALLLATRLDHLSPGDRSDDARRTAARIRAEEDRRFLERGGYADRRGR